jgi:hypothetical protein
MFEATYLLTKPYIPILKSPLQRQLKCTEEPCMRFKAILQGIVVEGLRGHRAAKGGQET